MVVVVAAAIAAGEVLRGSEGVLRRVFGRVLGKRGGEAGAALSAAERGSRDCRVREAA